MELYSALISFLSFLLSPPPLPQSMLPPRQVLAEQITATSTEPEILPLPAAFTIPVPFTMQAPFGVWGNPWIDACEESAIIMADAYYRGESAISKAQSRDRMLELIRWENAHFGFNKDTNARQTAELINLYYPWESDVVENPTLEQLKAELVLARPIITMVHGPSLHNPHFRSVGDYHVILLVGYDDDKKTFFAHEPGTRYGLDYPYSYNTIMDAIHDYVPGGKTKTGAKAVVFTHADVRHSGWADGDRDGLTKSEELERGTSLLKKN